MRTNASVCEIIGSTVILPIPIYFKSKVVRIQERTNLKKTSEQMPFHMGNDEGFSYIHNPCYDESIIPAFPFLIKRMELLEKKHSSKRPLVTKDEMKILRKIGGILPIIYIESE
jgi:hypothetical protein